MGNDNKIILIGIISLVLLCVAVSGCTNSSGTTTPGSASNAGSGEIPKLIIGTTNVPTDINIEDSNFQRFSWTLVFEGLVRMSPAGDFEPWLAVNWSTNDSQTWVFKLATNSSFHDGVPVTANDVNFTLGYLKKMGSIIQMKAVTSVETPDNYTVVIHLSTPNSNALIDLAMFRVLPEHIFKDVTNIKTFNDINATIGSGPYGFVNYDKAAGIMTFRAVNNSQYGRPAIDTIEVHTYKTEDAMIMAMQKGEIDTTYMYSKGISYFNVPKLLQAGNIKIMTIPQIGISKALFYNTQKYPYNVSQFREALTYAVNYDELNLLYTGGYGSMPDAGFVTNGTYGYVPTRKLTYDVNKSKAMLDALGFKDSNGDGFREFPDGSKFQPDLVIGSGSSENARLTASLKTYFNAVGLNVNTRLLDSTVLSDTLTKRSHDMAITNPSNYGMMMWAGYGTGFCDNRSNGNSVVTDPKFLSMVDRLLNSTDTAQQLQIASELQAYYASNYPAFALYLSPIIEPYNEKYEGFVATPVHGVLSIETLYGLHYANA
jgi:peptide/nickel transport system substrate-binding protein